MMAQSDHSGVWFPPPLWYAKNHPFVDGNKRIAFTTAIMFLELNGYRFEGGEADAVVRTLALAAGELKELEYARWLKAHSKRASRT